MHDFVDGAERRRVDGSDRPEKTTQPIRLVTWSCEPSCHLRKEALVLGAVLERAKCVAEVGIWNGTVIGFFVVPSFDLGVPIQTSQNELKKCSRKMFADPRQKALDVMIIDFVRRHEFVEHSSNLCFREMLLADPVVVDG